jgi:hypothetical protein
MAEAVKFRIGLQHSGNRLLRCNGESSSISMVDTVISDSDHTVGATSCLGVMESQEVSQW